MYICIYCIYVMCTYMYICFIYIYQCKMDFDKFFENEMT